MFSELADFVTIIKTTHDQGVLIVVYIALGAYIAHRLHQHFTSKECLEHSQQLRRLEMDIQRLKEELKHSDELCIERVKEANARTSELKSSVEVLQDVVNKLMIKG